MLTLHSLKPKEGTRKKKKRVGRGGAHGTTATRGTKGQKARSGYKRRFGFEGGRTPLIKQLPKLRGFNSLQARAEVVTLADLENAFSAGDAVTAASLKKYGVISSRNAPYKIVSKGELKKKLTVHGSVSDSAKKAIEAAGGSVIVKSAKDSKSE